MTLHEYIEKHSSKMIYYCKRLRLLTFLKSKGILPFASEADKNNPKYNVYLYHVDEKLLTALYQYFELGERE